jgi:hypothetical protein
MNWFFNNLRGRSFFSSPANKTKIGIANRSDTTKWSFFSALPIKLKLGLQIGRILLSTNNSKQPGPIKLSSQSTAAGVRLLGFDVPFNYQPQDSAKCAKNAEPKPFGKSRTGMLLCICVCINMFGVIDCSALIS